MTTLHDKANAEMAHEAHLYERAYYHLTSQVGPEVMDELAAAKTLKAAVDNVISQRQAKGIRIGEPLDLKPLGLTVDQLVTAAEFRQVRAERLAEVAQPLNDVFTPEGFANRFSAGATTPAAVAESKGTGFGGKGA